MADIIKLVEYKKNTDSSKIEVTLIVNDEVKAKASLSVFSELIMLHGPFMSCQWPIDIIGIELAHNRDNIKLGFHNTVISQVYQSFYFDKADYDIIHGFFKDMGFPLPKN